MNNCRLITPNELKIIRKSIDSKFGTGIFEKIKEGYQIFVVIGKDKQVFLTQDRISNFLDNLPSSSSPFFFGIKLGMILKNQFKLNLAALELLAIHSEDFIIVSDKGEQTALYGRNIPKFLIKKIAKKFSKGNFVIIKNQEKESIALGKFLIDSENLENCNRNEIVIKVLMDLGWYIREGH